MRYTSFIAAGLLAVSASAQTTTTSSAAATTSSALTEVEKCLNACDPADVDCRAHCIAVPSPDDDSVNATNECVKEKCGKSDGSAEENLAWGVCMQQCVEDYYFASTGTPNLTTGKAGGSDHTSAAVTHVPTTFTSNGSTFTSTIASTPSDAPTESEGAGPAETTTPGSAAAGYGPVGTGMGLFALLAGVLAL